ncbi:MAG: sulfatase-like hydrolase/transferase [Acidimicrobiales bacterium]
MDRPNILLIMTDEERYPPPYESDAVRSFRVSQLPARESIRVSGVEFHRHYAGSTACTPSRATLFTGQYPSLHGVSSTAGVAKQSFDPAMGWLDPNSVPTLGDWFRAGGYESHYRGKWHISHADLVIPGSHDSLMASDEDGNPVPDVIAAYRKADRLDPFGFSGWIGREPHGAAKSDCGTVRDGIFAEQVVELFDEMASTRAEGPWLTVASFVNPHDIAFSGFGWEQLLQFGPPDDTVPVVPEPPSQSDSFAGRPPCQEAFKATWPQMIFETDTDLSYRRLYYYLHKLVDRAIGRILEALERSGMAEETIVVFTSDHGDLLGAHGGLVQKWFNAFDEATRVPLVISGPGVSPRSDGISIPTSHVDLVPTLLGLAGIDQEEAAARVAEHHDEAQPLPGRDLSSLIRGTERETSVATPIYFMTEDNVTMGSTQVNIVNGKPFEALRAATSIESVITTLPTGEGDGNELWKLNHYYERLDDWYEAKGMARNPFLGPAAEPLFELHNITADPEERRNRVSDAPRELSQMLSVLDSQRDEKRRIPSLRNTPQ